MVRGSALNQFTFYANFYGLLLLLFIVPYIQSTD